LCSSYEETDKSWYISKDNLFREAIDYFKVSDTASNKRIFFEIIGRNIFGKIPEFMTVNLKSKKQIRGLQKRGVRPGSNAAQSARDRNSTEMKCEIKNDSREGENERNVNSGVVSEDIEGVTIDTEVEKTGGNKEDKIGREDENERNVNSEAVSGVQRCSKRF